MTPMEQIARRVCSIVDAAVAPLPVECILLDALAGTSLRAAPSAVSVAVYATEQHTQPIDSYRFNVPVALRISASDSPGGELFSASYNALFAALFEITQGDGQLALGSEGEPFSCNGATLTCDEPDLVETDEESFWTVEFTLHLVGVVTLESPISTSQQTEK